MGRPQVSLAIQCTLQIWNQSTLHGIQKRNSQFLEWSPHGAFCTHCTSPCLGPRLVQTGMVTHTHALKRRLPLSTGCGDAHAVFDAAKMRGRKGGGKMCWTILGQGRGARGSDKVLNRSISRPASDPALCGGARRWRGHFLL